MDGTMAVITTWAADFAPKNWACCNGQLLSVSQNIALFSLLGSTYGGDGTATFALPDMRSRTATGTGQGNSLSNYTLGQVGGAPTVALTGNNVPPHTHGGAFSFSLQANATDGTSGEPGGNYPGNIANGYSNANNISTATPSYTAVVGTVGSGTPYDAQAPYLAVNYIICTTGIFPTRS